MDNSRPTICENNLSVMQDPQFYMQFYKMSNGQRKNLKYTDNIFVNGREYCNVVKTTNMQSYWCLEEPDFRGPLYYLPRLPHIITKTPAKLFAEYKRLEEFFRIYDSIETAFSVAGLTIHDGAYPRGGFANAAEYERFVSLYIGNRQHEIAGYLGALAGAPAFNSRDPFPHGHCYLLLVPHNKQFSHYREGQDILTKEILERMWPDIKRDRIICYELRAVDAHLTLDKRPGANQILIKCGDLADKLKEAFEDGIADHEELTDIYYATPQVNRQ